MSTADDSYCEVEPILRAALEVNIGKVNVLAILDYTSPFNAVHNTVFERIREEEDEDEDQTYENLTIELDLSIDNHSVTVVFRVVPDLWTDMVLGEDFIGSVKAHIHLELRLFKWSCEDELVITEMVENYDHFRAISGGSCASNGTKSSEKEEIESTAPQEPSSSKKKRRRRRRKSKNNDPSASSDSIDSQLQQLKLDTNDSTLKNPKKDEFVKIFIAEINLWDMLSGEFLSYYGIYSSQVNISLFKDEVLDTKEKNPLGYHMEALHDAFGAAGDHGVTCLHILSENEDAINVMIAQQKKYEEDGDMEPEEYPRVWGLHRPDDLINYYRACYGIPGFKSLKFEYVPSDDKNYEEMEHARELLDDYIMNNLIQSM